MSIALLQQPVQISDESPHTSKSKYTLPGAKLGLKTFDGVKASWTDGNQCSSTPLLLHITAGIPGVPAEPRSPYSADTEGQSLPSPRHCNSKQMTGEGCGDSTHGYRSSQGLSGTFAFTRCCNIQVHSAPSVQAEVTFSKGFLSPYMPVKSCVI